VSETASSRLAREIIAAIQQLALELRRPLGPRRLYEEGGRQPIVYCATEPACALYESLGFRIHASLVEYSR
jgi:ribosomal protein S18 acetylase RimI-like enzyme